MSGALSYQPAFDGIRCFGVIGVILAHVAMLTPLLGWFGSYLFVDMFFVLSGYLITTLVLREHVENGRVSFKAFYARRLTRLYPMVMVALVAGVVQILTLPDSTGTPTPLGLSSIMLYFSNFVAMSSHADGLGVWSPMWSLSVEEQFYFIWPGALLLIVGRGLRVRRALLMVSVLTVTLWIWRSYSWARSTSDPGITSAERTHAWHVFYYSTFHRPDGLLVGCAIALVLALEGSRWTEFLIRMVHAIRLPILVGLAALIVASSRRSSESQGEWLIYFGLAAFNILIALLLVEFLHRPRSLITRFFSLRPFSWVGRRTYSIYVLHVGVFTVALSVFHIDDLVGVVITTTVIFVIAGLSYRFYEDPIRRWGHRFSKRILDRR